MIQDSDRNEEFEFDEEYENDIITLENEDGDVYCVEVIDMTEHNDIQYLAVIPFSEDANESLQADAMLTFMKITQEDDEEIYDEVIDEEELEEIKAVFTKRLENFYDIDDGITQL